MSLTFKFDKSNENNPGIKDNHNDSTNDKNVEHYNETSNVRNLHLINASGNHYSLNYAYLMSHEFSHEENIITLFFTTHIIKLKGQNLDTLFDDFLIHKPKKIICSDKRYEATVAQTEIYITDIKVEKI